MISGRRKLIWNQLTELTQVDTEKQPLNNNNYYNHFTALWILSRTIRVSQYHKGKTNLDFTEARDSE